MNTTPGIILAPFFLDALPGPAQLGWQDFPYVENALHSAWMEAREEWTNVDLPGPMFAAHLAAQWPESAPPSRDLRPLHTKDLYLAAACLHKRPQAVASFQRSYRSNISAALARLRQPVAFFEDVYQELMQRLFTAAPDIQPRISEYSGRGALKNWAITVALRIALNRLGAC